MMSRECARTREVVKVLEMLNADLKELPLQGDHDPRLAAAFEVACHGDDAELDAEQALVLQVMQLRAHARLHPPEERTAFRASLPAYATEEG